MPKEKDELRAILDGGGGNNAASQEEGQDNTGRYFKEAMKEVFNPSELDLRTHVTDTDIEDFSDIETISQYFGGIPVVNFKVEKEKRLLISKNRGSRNEMREIAVGVSASGDPQKLAEQRRLEGLLGKR
jgi:hypothetical protein